MKKFKKISLILMASIMTLSLAACSKKSETEGSEFITPSKRPDQLPIATIKVKDFGVIEAELYPDKAPNTVNNFIELANSKFYDGLIFHRVIKGFMNQGGCPDGIGTGGPGYSIMGEFTQNGYEYNDIKHTKGVLSMARAQNPNSAGSQFFIMAEDAPHLDNQYAGFGKVISGMDVVTAINNVSTGNNDKPVEDVVIEEIRVDTKGIEYPKAKRLE